MQTFNNWYICRACEHEFEDDCDEAQLVDCPKCRTRNQAPYRSDPVQGDNTSAFCEEGEF
jgi:DNA-directed RNA polymerase subunit RPC12/RpoP